MKVQDFEKVLTDAKIKLMGEGLNLSELSIETFFDNRKKIAILVDFRNLLAYENITKFLVLDQENTNYISIFNSPQDFEKQLFILIDEKIDYLGQD